VTSALILAALAKNGPDGPESLPQRKRASDHDYQRNAGQQGADAQQNGEHEHGGEKPAGEINQARAQQIANAVHVGHDARHQGSGLVSVEVCDGQPADVGLHLAAQFGNQALTSFGYQLRDGEPRHALDDSGAQDRQHQGSQQP
jgi:hypothetical protein